MDGGVVTTPGAKPIAAGEAACYAHRDSDGALALHAFVEGIHCGGCVAKIERVLAAHPAVLSARVNLSTRRLVLKWRGAEAIADVLLALIAAIGFKAVPFDPLRLAQADRAAQSDLLRALAVAGFAAANVMLLSLAIWAGRAEGMDPATRAMLHWFSGLIALPALIYSIRPFVHSAWRALRARTLNMDVPIVVGIALTAGMSLFETINAGDHAYFDSAISLVFFLLLGRYLDLRARGQARGAAERLLALTARAVTVLAKDGTSMMVAAGQVEPGAVVLVAPGERIGVDGVVAFGKSEIDSSIITGESVPASVQPGDAVFAGAVNLGAALRVTTLAAGESTLLAEIVRLMEAAEQRKSRYIALADRVSRLYAPVVHLLALLTFGGWWLAGASWDSAMVNAIAVLIVTCPCALGLAVPAVQVIATGQLMRRGILLKSDTALERLATVDTVVFDKTGTLTLGRPALVAPERHDPAALQLAAGMAGNSTHPLARALCRAAPRARLLDAVRETPGAGLSLDTPEGEIRLGSRTWCGVASDVPDAGMELWLKRPGHAPRRFTFADDLRPDATDVVATLKRQGYAVKVISGDRRPAVAAIAAMLGVEDWQAETGPVGKSAILAQLAAAGRKVLMVGDGLNDAPALAAAHVSLSPSTAADISQTAADAIFQGAELGAVTELLATANKARRLVRQNIGAAIAYNLVAVPIAVLGLLTPFLAAIAMSSSSLGVVGNALRLARGRSP